MAQRTERLGSVNSLERGLILVTTLLVVLGVVFVGSAAAPQAIANGGSVWGFMARDLIMVGCGALCFVVASRFPAARMSKLAVPVLIGSGALLVVVKLLGTTTSGGTRWLSFGSFSFQPSELFTLASCFYLAYVVARVERNSRHWIDILKWCLPVFAGAVLVFIEPDMGTASVIVIVTVAVLWLAGLPGRLLTILLAMMAVGGVILAALAPYRWARVTALFHPGASSSGTGYQVFESKIGLGAGHLSGLGFGASRGKWGYLPNPHTDFIFSVIGEELGLIGAVTLLALFIWLICLGLRTAQRAPDREGQLLASGVTMWFAVETFINVASVLGLWPVTGIPLPLISYGGTSLVINLAALGLLVNVARRTSLRVTHGANTRVSTLRPAHVVSTTTAASRVHASAGRERRRRG
jgi:cell division protein FtsW